MIKLNVLGVTHDSDHNMPILLLQSKEEGTVLPIWIGNPEAVSISAALNKASLDRPLTHEIALKAIINLGGTLVAAEIVGIHKGAYIANLILQSGMENEKFIRIDCRPSDAIAMALRANAPISTNKEVMDSAQKYEVKRCGEDLISSFFPANASKENNNTIFKSVAPVSRYKM